MPKQIVICCDGTSNMFKIAESTNVLHLYSCLGLGKDQIGLYEPGVGTYAPDNIRGNLERWWFEKTDLLIGHDLKAHVLSAYEYLMTNYEPGDSLYFFGFSRGAYTVRFLAGLLEMWGLLYKDNTTHLKYILTVYSAEKSSETKNDEELSKEEKDKKYKIFRLAAKFKSRFSRPIEIKFMGIWDTVSSVGGIINPEANFYHTRSLTNVETVRHAVAIDERRKHYHVQKVSPKHLDMKEVYFAGVHSDVGGSYKEDGLSKISLKWMIGEAKNAGLKFDYGKIERYVLGKDGDYSGPDYTQKTHNSMTAFFLFSELLPRNGLKHIGQGKFKRVLDFSINRPRPIESGERVHFSVFKKRGDPSCDYNPPNLREEGEYRTEMDSIIEN